LAGSRLKPIVKGWWDSTTSERITAGQAVVVVEPPLYIPLLHQCERSEHDASHRDEMAKSSPPGERLLTQPTHYDTASTTES
jgi:hypothetical protein